MKYFSHQSQADHCHLFHMNKFGSLEHEKTVLQSSIQQKLQHVPTVMVHSRESIISMLQHTRRLQHTQLRLYSNTVNTTSCCYCEAITTCDVYHVLSNQRSANNVRTIAFSKVSHSKLTVIIWTKEDQLATNCKIQNIQETMFSFVLFSTSETFLYLIWMYVNIFHYLCTIYLSIILSYLCTNLF